MSAVAVVVYEYLMQNVGCRLRETVAMQTHLKWRVFVSLLLFLVFIYLFFLLSSVARAPLV